MINKAANEQLEKWQQEWSKTDTDRQAFSVVFRWKRYTEHGVLRPPDMTIQSLLQEIPLEGCVFSM